jgi:hypothetical protein
MKTPAGKEVRNNSIIRTHKSSFSIFGFYPTLHLIVTMSVLEKCGEALSPRCQFGCNKIEDQHHIFVDCGHFQYWRDECHNLVLGQTNSQLENANVDKAT